MSMLIQKTSLLRAGDTMCVDSETWTCSAVSEAFSSWTCDGSAKTASWPHASLQRLMDGGLQVLRHQLPPMTFDQLIAGLEALVTSARSSRMAARTDDTLKEEVSG